MQVITAKVSPMSGRAPPATGEPPTLTGGVLMDAQPNGMQTHGRKGFSYDWQSLLVPAEPEFSKQLNDIINDDTVSADLGS